MPKKGFRHSEETKAKLRAANLGRVASPETRAKMREARKNQEPISEEARAKISAAKKGKPCSPETKAKISATQKGRPGRPHTEEEKAKISAATKGHWVSEATRERARAMGKSGAGRKRSPEHVAKVAAAITGKKRSPEHCERQSQRQRGRKMSPEWVAKVAAANTGSKRTPEQRARMSKGMTGVKRSPEACERLRALQNSPEELAKRSGPNHYNWKGGATTERGGWEQSGGRKWKRDCRKRDGYACALCGEQFAKTSPGLHVHHKASFGSYPALRSEPDNGVCVCEAHHDWLHSKAGERKRAALERETLKRFGYEVKAGGKKAVQAPLFAAAGEM